MKSSGSIQRIALLSLLGLMGCAENRQESSPSGELEGQSCAEIFTVVTGSENAVLKPLIDRFANDKGVKVKFVQKGSVEIMMGLEDGSLNADAVWPANSLWIDLGDKHRRVRYSKSIARMPVVFGVKQSRARELGWVNKPVKVDDILKAAEKGKLRYMMTSASQSNSGASAYLGYLYAFSGHPEVLTMQHLQSPNLRKKIKRILGTVNRTSGSSGWLKDLFLSKYGYYDGMVNYEAVVIEMNNHLVSQGKEPLQVIYPVDGLAIADSPLGYIDNRNPDKEILFKELQNYLLSPLVQKEIQQTGRRVGGVGLSMPNANPAIFNPKWDVNTRSSLVPVKVPGRAVMKEALTLYQTAFRKPSLTIYCLDFSTSMEGEGIERLKSAMAMLLKTEEAKKYFLQASSGDVTGAVPFCGHVIDRWVIQGSSVKDLEGLLSKIYATELDDVTNIYSPTAEAIRLIKKYPVESYLPAIVLMTDGQSNTGELEEVKTALKETGLSGRVPVYAVLFGEADQSQLQEICTMTSGKIFDGRQDLIAAFREVKGYN